MLLLRKFWTCSKFDHILAVLADFTSLLPCFYYTHPVPTTLIRFPLHSHHFRERSKDIVETWSGVVGWLVGWLCFTSNRQRGHLETAPPFTVPCEGLDARFLHRSKRESNPKLWSGVTGYKTLWRSGTASGTTVTKSDIFKNVVSQYTCAYHIWKGIVQLLFSYFKSVIHYKYPLVHLWPQGLLFDALPWETVRLSSYLLARAHRMWCLARCPGLWYWSTQSLQQVHMQLFTRS